MTEIVIQGIGGRMGHVLCDMIAQREDCRVVAGIDVKDGEQNGIPVYDSLEKLNGKGDVSSVFYYAVHIIVVSEFHSSQHYFQFHCQYGFNGGQLDISEIGKRCHRRCKFVAYVERDLYFANKENDLVEA